MKTKNSGTIGIDLMLVLVLVGAFAAAKPSGGPGKDHWWEFWKKNPIAQVQKSQSELDKIKADTAKQIAEALAKVKLENDKQVNSAHEGSVATVAAIAAAQKKASGGEIPTKELDTAKKTAAVTRDALDAATGAPVDPVRVRELETMVANLNAGVVAGTKALDTLQGVLDASIAREKVSVAKVNEVTKAAEAKVSAAEDKFEKKQAEANTWALQRDAIARSYENMRFYVILGVSALFLIWLSSWLLPILSKSMPALEPLAHTVGAMWAPGLQIVKNQSTRLNEDLVAMTEVLKNKLSEHLTPEAMAALKKEIGDDWMTVKDGSAQEVDRLKAKLRL